jgi:hypothetical protein
MLVKIYILHIQLVQITTKVESLNSTCVNVYLIKLDLIITFVSYLGHLSMFLLVISKFPNVKTDFYLIKN